MEVDVLTANLVPVQGKSQEILTSADLDAIEKVAALGSGFNNIRQSSFAKTLALPFPTGSHELWRYTKPDHFDFNPSTSTASAPTLPSPVRR